MNPAALRQRVGLYAPSDVADDLGGTVRSWTFQRALWARVKPQSISETREDGRLVLTQRFHVTIRYQPNFPRLARLMWGERLFRVLAASDPDAKGERLHLICEEERR